MANGIYRVGLSMDEMSEESLKKSGLKYHIVNPREQIVISAKKVLGKPYKRGASVLKDAPNFFDCSSLTAWCAVEAGLSIPRISIDQYVFSKRINKEDLKAGDSIFVNTGKIIHTDGSYFSQVLGKNVKEEAIRTKTVEYQPGTKVPEGIDHVGIYVGDGRVIHASFLANGVVEDLIGSQSFENIIGYGRIIKDENKRFVVEIPVDRVDLRKKENLLQKIKQ